MEIVKTFENQFNKTKILCCLFLTFQNQFNKPKILCFVFAGDNLRSLHTNSSSDLKVSTFFLVLMMTSSLVLIQCLNGSVRVGDYPLRITETDGEKDIHITESSERETKSGCLLRKSSEIVVR